MANSSANTHDISASDSPIWFLQWTAGESIANKPNFKEDCPSRHLAVLLQESGAKRQNLIRYKPYCTLSIQHRRPGTGPRTTDPVANGQACVLVLSRAAHTELDTSAWCPQTQGVAGVRLTLDGDQRALVISVYARSFGATTYRVDVFSGILLKNLSPRIALLLGAILTSSTPAGDINAQMVGEGTCGNKLSRPN